MRQDRRLASEPRGYHAQKKCVTNCYSHARTFTVNERTFVCEVTKKAPHANVRSHFRYSANASGSIAVALSQRASSGTSNTSSNVPDVIGGTIIPSARTLA